MTTLMCLNVIYPILATSAMLLLAYKNKNAFLLFLVVEVCMMYIGLETKQYGVLLMAVLYFLANIFAYYKWRENERD